MRKIHLLGLALFAVFVFGVLAVASASAVTTLLAEFLIGGKNLVAELAAKTIGELLLEDTKASGGAPVAVKECAGILDGTVGPNSQDLITEALTPGGGTVKQLVAAEAITCKEETGSCPTPLVWPVNLPWTTEAVLMIDEGVVFFADLILPTAPNTTIGWEVECMGIIPLVDTCTTNEGVSQFTLSPDLLGEFSEAFTVLAEAKLANCSLGGAETGVVEGTGLIEPDGTEELSVSSEGMEA